MSISRFARYCCCFYESSRIYGHWVSSTSHWVSSTSHWVSSTSHLGVIYESVGVIFKYERGVERKLSVSKGRVGERVVGERVALWRVRVGRVAGRGEPDPWRERTEDPKAEGEA